MIVSVDPKLGIYLGRRFWDYINVHFLRLCLAPWIISSDLKFCVVGYRIFFLRCYQKVMNFLVTYKVPMLKYFFPLVFQFYIVCSANNFQTLFEMLWGKIKWEVLMPKTGECWWLKLLKLKNCRQSLQIYSCSVFCWVVWIRDTFNQYEYMYIYILIKQNCVTTNSYNTILCRYHSGKIFVDQLVLNFV